MDSIYKKIEKILNFGGKNYFQDVGCGKITILLGVVAGVFNGSLLDFSFGRGWIDPNYYTPYRTFLNKLIICLSPFVILLITIIFIISLVRSRAVSSMGKLQRFLLTIFFAVLIAIIVSLGWVWIISFIARIKSMIF